LMFIGYKTRVGSINVNKRFLKKVLKI